MMKATPPSPLVVAEPELLLQVLVVALDPPSQLGSVHQPAAADVWGQRGEKVFRWLGFVGGPFDQAPFLWTRCGAFIIAMRGADTYGREAPGELDLGPFAPGHPPPSLLGKVERQLLGRDRLMLGVATERGGRTATPAPLLWRQRFHARRPQAGRGLDADGVGKADLGDPVAEIGVVAVSRVGQYDFGADPGRNGRTQLVQGDLWLGLEGDIFGYASCG